MFFFQAEDGIRDLTVTGVQTCALPIYGKGMQTGLQDAGNLGWKLAAEIHTHSSGQRHTVLRSGFLAGPWQARSEERRVGKSVDLGGRRIIKKKKKSKSKCA